MNNTKIRVAFVDDNAEQLLLYEDLIQEFFSDELEVVATFSKPLEAIKKLPTLQIDLLFLDVEMPQIDGFELLQMVSPYAFKVVMTTGHESFAFPAFKANVFDYLVKPLSVKAVKETIIKYRNTQNPQSDTPAKQYFSNSENNHEEKLVVNSHESVYIIPVRNIVRLEAKGAYTMIFYKDKSVTSSKPISYYEQTLNTSFYRVHRSHLININQIVAIEKEEDGEGTVIMSDDSRVALSKLKKNELIRLISG